ncbi:hypothetical protein NtRootA9_35290 [Arthrobacter sp. NtRootA9]|nr:hypothetical protein NtRootA9_35290 [Arthrobacter sp. NtRootA9]
MTLQSYLIEAGAIDATAVPRGGTYVTLPAGAEVPPTPQGSYVSLPGELPGNANKAQGTYVTLPSVPAGETEISYTRVG